MISVPDQNVIQCRATGLYVSGMSIDKKAIEVTPHQSRAERVGHSAGRSAALACLITQEFPQFDFRAVQVAA